MIPKTVRYCIQCGREIGDAATCDACGGLPNFYRHVPGPQSERKPGVKRPPSPARAPPSSLLEAATRNLHDSAPGGLPVSVPLPEDRHTISIDAAPVAFLRSTVGPVREEPLLPGPNEIGARSPARIIIDRPEVSSRHARIDCALTDEGAWAIAITDHKSTNGTFVNGKRIEKAKLSTGDRVRIGKVEFEIRPPGPTQGSVMFP